VPNDVLAGPGCYPGTRGACRAGECVCISCVCCGRLDRVGLLESGLSIMTKSSISAENRTRMNLKIGDLKDVISRMSFWTFTV